MSQGRQTPLFEVLRRDARRGRAVEAVPAEPERAESPVTEPIPDEGAVPRVTVPLATVYMTVFLVLALCLVSGLLGYSFGFQRGEGSGIAAAQAQFYKDYPYARPEYRLTEPLEDGALAGEASPAGGTGASGSGAEAAPGRSGSGGAGTGGGALAAAFMADGPVADPRRPGNNYLGLATVPPEDARRALAFLSERGMRAVAVRVDSGGGRSNTSPRYRLYALELAVPSERYRAMESERRELEQRYRRVGAELRRETAISDFSQTRWERY